MQCIVVKSGEFENSYSLLYILLKSCLCRCSLATIAPQQLQHLILSCHFNIGKDQAPFKLNTDTRIFTD